MSTEEIAGIYLSIIVTILIFGIGFPAFIYNRPTWLRRIRDRYSVWANLQKTIAFVLFLVAIIVAAYLFSDNIVKHCVIVGNCHYYWGNSVVLPDIIFILTVLISIGITSAAIFALWTWLEVFGEQKKGVFKSRWLRRSFKSFISFFLIALIGTIWANIGLWLINKSSTNDTMKIIRTNDKDILNILVLIGLLSSALLWSRLYLFRSDTIRKRLIEVAECRYHLRRRLFPFSCYNYCLLQFRYILFDDKKEHPLDKSIQALGIMGTNAASIGDRWLVLNSLENLIEKNIPLSTYGYILGATKDTLGGTTPTNIDLFKKAIQLIQLMALKISSIAKHSLPDSTKKLSLWQKLSRIISQIVIFLHANMLRLEQKKVTFSEADVDITLRLLGITLKDIGSEALVNAASWDAAKLKKLLIDAVDSMPEGQQADMIYSFGVAAQQVGHTEISLEFLNELIKQQPVDWRIYWPGLLARMAKNTDVGYNWAARMAQSRGFTHQDLNEAQQAFIGLDMETAQAIAKVQE